MIQEVKYRGYTAAPSDYDCPDGDLAASLNLIPDGTTLVPLPPPVEVGSQPIQHLADGAGVYVHSLSTGQRNYILIAPISKQEVQLKWCAEGIPPDFANASVIGLFDGVNSFAALGNTIVIATRSGLKYLLWKDGAYFTMGEKPPQLAVDFALHRLPDAGRYGASGEAASWVSPKAPAMAIWSQESQTDFENIVFAAVNKGMAEMTAFGRFMHPFYVRYAYRLYDGSYAWASPPVLMLPSVLPPLVTYTDDYVGTDKAPARDGTVNAVIEYRAWCSQLLYRLLPDGVSELKELWSDIISGIDIFVTPPIYPYKNSITRAATTFPEAEFDGQGAAGGYVVSSGTGYCDYFRREETYHIVDFKENSDFMSELASAHNFYLISQIDLSELSSSEIPQEVKIRQSILSTLTSQPSLFDSSHSYSEISHRRIIPNALSAYNNRLTLADVKLAPPRPFSLRLATAYANPDAVFNKQIRITVWSRLNGLKVASSRSWIESDTTGLYCNIKKYFPRFLFYPDASAYKMKIELLDTGESFVIDLKPHDFLDGAYYLCSNLAKTTPPNSAEEEPGKCNEFVEAGNRIYTSEINNPFLFTATGSTSLGADVGTVFATCTAAKALSQGQFGQFPLYAFTDGGVWALEVGADGAYTARQPITRDVCICPEAITQIDSAVLFPTNRGIMLISGSECQCISDTINTEYPFASLSMPHMPELHKRLGSVHISDNCLDILPFTEFLKNCRMIYDYVHQRIFVYNALKEVSYAYVYSLRSRQWGMTYCDIASNLNSYPNALAINHSGHLVDFSLDNRDADTVPALMITRPLKLGDGDLLKTIDTVIQRGNFARGHVQSVLYGSRDLRSWHTVWSSTDHAMRGFRGSPYKYFRIALLCKLHPSESITGASIQFTPRQANKLH